jgi:hypothetical protein
MIVTGWTGAYTSNFKITPFTPDRKQALIEIIKRRHYSFNHFDHEYMDCTPLYDDGKICVLTKSEFDEVINTAYATMIMGGRLTPQDAIKDSTIDGILFENEKFKKEYLKTKGDEING